MRHLNTGRGQHHKATSTTRRLLTFADTGATIFDRVDNVTMTATGGFTRPTDGWLGPTCLSFNGTTGRVLGAADNDDTYLSANTWTLGVVWRRRASAAGTMFCYGGNGALSATNVLIRANMAADGSITVEWESGAGVIHSQVVTGYVLPLNRWVYLHFIRISATSVRVCANARALIDLNMVTANVGGGSSVWTIGCDEDSTDHIAADIGSFYLEDGIAETADMVEDLRRATLQAFPTSVRARVAVKDGLGVYRELTDLEGHDWVESIGINVTADDACETLEVELMREFDYLSLATLVTSSALNLTDTMNLASYSALIDIQREIRVQFARVPLGQTVAATDWMLRFYGHVDSIDVGGDTIKISARDQGGRLIDDFLAEDMDMPITFGVNCVADPVTGERRASVEEAIADIIGVAVYAPTPANLCLVPWEQKKDSKMAAARAIAACKAWDFKYRFDESPGQNTWRPTLVDPGRDRLDGDGAFTANDYASLSKASIDVFGIRNRVFVTFPDQTRRNSENQKLPFTTDPPLQDTVSRDRYGGFFRTIFITEGQLSPIDRLVEATTMASGILADLKDQLIDVDAPINDCFFEAEVNDYYTFVGDNVHFTGNLELACSSVALSYSEGSGEANLGCRGVATAGSRRWLALDARPRMNAAPWGVGSSSSNNNVGHGIDRRQLIQMFDYGSHSVRSSIGQRGSLVRNPDFDRWTLGPGYMPDGWFSGPALTGASAVPSSNVVLSRELPQNVQIATTISSVAARSLYIPRNVYSGPVISDLFQVEAGKLYGLDTIIRQDNSGLDIKYVVDFYDASRVFISGTPIASFVNSALSVFAHRGGDGTSNFGVVTAPSTARYARLAIANTTSGIGIPNVADWYLDYATIFLVPYESSAFLAGTLSPVVDNTWTDLVSYTESFDYGAAFNSATGIWTCPEDGSFTLKARIHGRVNATNASTFNCLVARFMMGITEIARSPVAAYSETVATDPSNGFAFLEHTAAFTAGQQVRLQGLLGRVTGQTPVRQFIGGSTNSSFFKTKQVMPGFG